MKKAKEVNEVWEEYWKPQIYRIVGGGENYPSYTELNEEELKKILYDYYYTMHEVEKVYCEITGGLLSKAGYSSETIIEAHEEYQKRQKEYDKENTISDDKDVRVCSLCGHELEE